MYYNVQKKKKISLKVPKNNFSGNITSHEFSILMNKIGFFHKKPLLGIAYSGGSDSLALLLKLSEWSISNDGKLIAFIVDHDLKRRSREESEDAMKVAQNLSVETYILKWQGMKPYAGIMKKARDKRYELIENECKKKDIFHLFTAHHQDDQLETFYMRSKRKGFSLGLSSMEMISEKTDIRIIKPFLSVPKIRLVETCRFHNCKWISDPLNKVTDFERIKVRNFLKSLKKSKKSFYLKEIQLKKKVK